MQGSEVAVYRFASTPVPWVGFTNPRQRLRCRVAIKSQDKSVTLSVIIIIPVVVILFTTFVCFRY